MTSLAQQLSNWIAELLRGPMTALRGADPVLGLALVVLLALLVANALHRHARLPRLFGYLLVGALASTAMFDLISRADLDPWKPLIDLGVAALVFELGTRLRPRWLIDNPWLTASCVLEALLAALAVGAALVALGAPGASASVAAAVAAATSPVITMAAVLEGRPRGQVAERLLTMSAFNSVLAILGIKLWPLWGQIGSSAAHDWSALLASAGVVIFGSLLLGLAGGWVLDRASRLDGQAATMPVMQIALVILMALLAVALGLSPLISLLVAGVTARTRMGHRLTVEPHLGSAGAALTVLLFVSFGVMSTLSNLSQLWPWVLAIILARLLGKGAGVAATARPSGLSWRQALALTLTLQPMSGLAVLLVADSFSWRGQLAGADGSVMQALLIATTLMQISGPLWALWPLQRIARECPLDDRS
ncbi:MAG: cation:proton antiporter [Burkholderiaceae bacterium]